MPELDHDGPTDVPDVDISPSAKASPPPRPDEPRVDQRLDHVHGEHRRRRLLMIGAVMVVVLLGAGLWFAFGGDRARQSSEQEARERLGAASTSVPTSGAGAAPLTSAPAIGLYRYQGSGHEHTSFPPLTEEQGPAMPATVTLDPNGCWVLRIDYNTHHWQDWTYCTADGQMVEQQGSTFSRRNLGGLTIDNTSQFTCDPPAEVLLATDQPGTTRSRSCSGTGSLIPASTTIDGSITVVGPEDRDVGGTRVSTVHVRYDLTYVGGQNGTETTDLWLLTTTGLPVRNTHHITAVTDTPFGQVTYTEDAELDLQTLTPV